MGLVGLAPFVLPPYPLALLTLALVYGLFAFGLDIAWGIVVRSRGLIPDYYTTAALVLLIVAVVWLFVLRGRLGRRALAVNLNPDRAAHLGIDVRGTRLSALVISAAVAAAAGAIAAPVMGLVSPSAGGIMLSTQVLVWL
ncbi:ABC transporter permease subunit, partial [Homoserinimonas sp. A520]